MSEFPMIISVDDHVVEPPNVWQDRLPAKYLDVGPRVIRSGVSQMGNEGGKYTFTEDPSATPCDFWLFEDLRYPMTRVMAAVGFDREEIKVVPITYDEMRPGCYDPKARMDDLLEAGIDGSMGFPSWIRFCGQALSEAHDKELGLACVTAYNDWMVEEWCEDPRLIPLIVVPLWDPTLAAAEVRRNADRGVRAVAFSEIPAYLGYPSIHDKDGYWLPFFEACNETGTVINMHIGSGSRMPSTSDDAPMMVQSTATFTNCMLSMCDWMFSGHFERFPDLKIAYSEGQIGWIPYILERADHVWTENRGSTGADNLTRPPSTYFADHIYGCFFADQFGLENIDKIGVENVLFECDYPHQDSTWPHTRKVAEEMTRGMDPAVVEKVMRGNAIKLLQLDR